MTLDVNPLPTYRLRLVDHRQLHRDHGVILDPVIPVVSLRQQESQ